MSSTRGPAIPKRGPTPKKAPAPTVSDLILQAASGYRGPGGVSLAALKKTLRAGGYDAAAKDKRLLGTLRRLVASGSLLQIDGSFALGSRTFPAPPRKTVRATKTKAAKKAQPVSRQTKSTTKKGKAKSPKKTKRAAATKTPRAPRRSLRRVSKPL